MRYLIISLLSFFFHIIPVSSAQKSGSKKKNDPIKTEQQDISKRIKKFIGTASYYAHKFSGRKTATGDSYNNRLLTAASNVLPLGSVVRVTNVKNNRNVLVRINDLMHPKNKRLIDLSYSAAKKLDYISAGITKVEVVVL